MIKISLKYSSASLEAMAEALAPSPHIKYAKAAARSAFYRFAIETRNNLRAVTPIGPTGNLRRATKAASTKGGGAKVYISREGGRTGSGYHSHLVEKGTRQRVTKSGKNRGIMPAAHYQRPVLEAARANFDETVIKRLEDQLRTKIAAEIRKGKLW